MGYSSRAQAHFLCIEPVFRGRKVPARSVEEFRGLKSPHGRRPVHGDPESAYAPSVEFVALQAAVVTDVDAAGVGGQVPGTEEEDGDSCDGPEEELHGEGGHQGLMGPAAIAGGPGEQKSAKEGSAGGKGQAEQCGDEAILQAGTGHKEGTDRDPVERHEADEERKCAGEFEKHWVAPSHRTHRDCKPDSVLLDLEKGNCPCWRVP